jgi:serine/threonine protein kinase
MDNEYYKRYEPFFGSWHIKRFIGAGSYGKVFEIERRDEFDTVFTGALKAITIPSSPDELEEILSDGMDRDGASTYFRDYVKDLNREIALMSKLKGHSNIVSYEDHQIIPHEDGIGWDILIRMELLRPINDALRQNKSFTRAEVIRLGTDLCRALEVCGQYNIIHRDIKPANIFISDTGDYKLGDFGVARIASASTGASTRAGTVNYMAPEVFRGEKYTANVDIYSLGLVMYQLLNANRMPFYPPYPQPITFSAAEQARARRLAGEALPLPSGAQDALGQLVCKACAPDPAQRFAGPLALRKALEALPQAQPAPLAIDPPGGRPDPLNDTIGTPGPDWHWRNGQLVQDPPADGADPEATFDPHLSPAPAPLVDETVRVETAQPAAPADDRTVRLMPADVPPAPAPAPEKDHTERVAAPAPQVPEMQDPDKTTVLFAAQAEQRRKQEQARRDAEEAARRAAEAEKEQARRAAEQAEAARKAAEAAAEKPAPEAKISRRKMLGILGGAAVVAVGVGVGGVAMLNKGEESAAVVASGSCGTDVQWSLDEKGVLRLSGTGRMTDYQNATEVPWEEMRNQITRVQFDDAITNIGNCAFYACSNLTEVITPKALSEVGKYSFAICTSLVSIDLPNGTKRIGEHAFTMDSALKSITIPSSVLGIGTEAFYNCERLTKVKINKNCSRGNDAFPRNVGISYY